MLARTLRTLLFSSKKIAPRESEKNREFNLFQSSSSTGTLLQYFMNNSDRLIHKWVDYFEVYEKHLSKYRDLPVTVLEIGVQNGGSAKMWKEYFGVGATIIGIDVDPKCKDLEHEGIKIYIGDQQDRSFWAHFKKNIKSVDIVIDDGGHSMEQQITSFEELFPILSDGGVYICEDTHTSYFPSHGGGTASTRTFHKYVMNLIDEMHGWYHQPLSEIPKNPYANSLYSIDIHDSIIALMKRKRNPPLVLARGGQGHTNLPAAMTHVDLRRSFGVSDGAPIEE